MQGLEQLLLGVALAAYLAAAVLYTFGLAFKRREAGGLAFVVLGVGFLGQTASIIARWVEGGQLPLTSLFETLVFLSWCVVLLSIIADRRYTAQAAGIILVPTAFFLTAAAVLMYEGPRELREELQTHWLLIHAGLSVFGYAAFTVAFATGFFYVVQEDLLKKKYQQVRTLIHSLVVAFGTSLGLYVGYVIADPTLFEDALGNRVYGYSSSDWTIIGVGAAVGLAASLVIGWVAARGASRPSFANRLPALHLLDRLSFHSVLFGLVLLAFGIVSGAMWAKVAWGSWWEWDPKETWALISWVFYAGYVGMRGLANWRGRNAALIAIVGMFLIVFTFLGINLFVPGRHDFN
ncbi:MAG: c-type cytochrome biogenesis protein CcsB [Actinobacteria bacterium]|nr:c-type cytochrome biogenesis protein CcsB [Actinomycetota bacterium]